MKMKIKIQPRVSVFEGKDWELRIGICGAHSGGERTKKNPGRLGRDGDRAG